MATVREVRGGNGLLLSVRQWGKPDGMPILFLHGMLQSHQCWGKQVESRLAEEFRLLAMDLRGHGMSEKPLAPEAYGTGRLWADDVANALEQLRLEKPILVASSYAGYVVGDYLAEYGDAALGGINFVGAAFKLTQDQQMVGPAFIEHAQAALSPDLPTRIEGTRSLLRACRATPWEPELFEQALAYNMVVPQEVRLGLVSRQLDFSDVLAQISVPTLVTFGAADRVILPEAGEAIAKLVPGATVSRYEGVGHAISDESPERFNEELGAFARKVGAG